MLLIMYMCASTINFSSCELLEAKDDIAFFSFLKHVKNRHLLYMYEWRHDP